MKRWLLPILVFCLIAFFGCSNSHSPVVPDLERNEQVAIANDYTFITGKTNATSWGDVYLKAAKIGYGNVPVRCGAYVYFIKYLSDFVPPYTPPKTVPVKYEIATGVVTQLGATSSGFDMWNKIDATNSGTLMTGKFSLTSVKRAGRTINLTYVTNAELSDDGSFVFYVQNNKAYRMNLSTMQKTTLCSNGYVAEVATNSDGSKAIIVTQVNGTYTLYSWNGSGLSTIGSGYAYYNGIDMSQDGIASFSVNGKCYWLNGSPQLVGTGVFPAVKDGLMLYANNGNLMSYDLGTGAGSTVATYSTAVQQVEWTRDLTLAKSLI